MALNITHVSNTRFVLFQDYLDLARVVCRRDRHPERTAHQIQALLRVLERLHGEQVKQVFAQGYQAEQLREDLLWFDFTRSAAFVIALGMYSETTFQRVLPKLIQAGYAQERYVKRTRSGQIVADELTGELCVYATYKEAQRDTKRHPGEIIHQLRLETGRLNSDLASLYQPDHPPTPEDEDADGFRQTNEDPGVSHESPMHEEYPTVDRTRGNLFPIKNLVIPFQTITPPYSQAQPPVQKGLPSLSIHKGWVSQLTKGLLHLSNWLGSDDKGVVNAAQGGDEKKQGAAKEHKGVIEKNKGGEQKKQGAAENHAQNAPAQIEQGLSHARELININNIKPIDSKNQDQLINSHSRACEDLTTFDFGQPLTPEAIITLTALIMPPVSLSDKVRSAAEVLASDGHDLRYLARLLAYASDPTSPCRWLAYLREQDGDFKTRLWHLTTKEHVRRKMEKEMEASGWWPSWLSADDPANQVLDLAELEGIAVLDRSGMDQETASALVDYIRQDLFPADEFPEVYVGSGLISRRSEQGCYVELWPGNGLRLRLYSVAHWEIFLAVGAQMDAPNFRRVLATAVREKRAA